MSKTESSIVSDNELYSFNKGGNGSCHILYDLANWKNGLAFKNIDFSPTGKPVIKIAELNDGIGPTTAYTEKEYPKEVYLQRGDFLFSWSGNPQTSIDIYRFRMQEGWLNQHIFKVIPNEKLVHRDFFFYLMKALKPNFTKIATNKQTTGLGHVTVADLKRLEVTIPDYNKQKKIAQILLSLDDKIELNNAINRNLEEQVKTLYTKLFVKERNGKEGLLGELISIKYGKDHKKLSDGQYPVYGSGGIMRYVDQFLYDQESVLIPRKGSLNNVMYVNEPFWSVDTMFYTEMKRPNIAKYIFIFLSSQNLESLNAGSAVPSMTTDILNAMKILIPNDDVLSEFENFAAPIYRKITDNTKENKELASIRDSLLPRLMSGELSR